MGKSKAENVPDRAKDAASLPALGKGDFIICPRLLNEWETGMPAII
jgi:hypothetical protein